MSAQKTLLSAELKKLSDDAARAYVLQCLFSSIGQGTSAPEMHRFIAVQTTKSVSKFRLDEMLHDLVKVGAIDLYVKTSKNGRITRTYKICGSGLILLISMTHLLHREIRKVNCERFQEVYKFALDTIKHEENLYKESIIIGSQSENEEAS